MQELLSASLLTNIHFPQRIKLIKNLRYASFLINDIVLLGSVTILFVWFTNLFGMKIFLFQKLAIIPSSSILFIFAGISLFFGAKRHIASNNESSEIHHSLWNAWIPILFAITTAFLGLVSLLHLNSLTIFLAFQMQPVAGLCFFFIGLALIPPFTRIPHRFHVSQFLVFIVSGVSMYIVLEHVFSTLTAISHDSIFLPFSLALTLAFFCFGILLRWSNRGFFGNFTLDSTGSRFAFRVFTINLIAVPLIVVLVLLAFQNKFPSSSEILSVIVVFFTFISSFLMWVNVRFLYNYELEHLLMRESLHAHNIDLTKEDEILRKRMTKIEQEKQQYAEKLNSQNSWRDAVDASE